eukprot:EG_transcript_41353
MQALPSHAAHRSSRAAKADPAALTPAQSAAAHRRSYLRRLCLRLVAVYGLLVVATWILFGTAIRDNLGRSSIHKALSRTAFVVASSAPSTPPTPGTLPPPSTATALASAPEAWVQPPATATNSTLPKPSPPPSPPASPSPSPPPP